MADTFEPEDARVHVVGAGTIQTHVFVKALNQHVAVRLHDRLEDALSLACLRGEMQSLVLIDLSYVGIERVLQILQETRLTPGAYLALLNVPRQLHECADSVAHGVRGLFFEDDDLEVIIRGVHQLLQGDIWIPRQTLYEAVVHPSNGAAGSDKQPPHSAARGDGELTRREREILAMICVGSSNQEISDKLFISTNTVKTHIYKIYKKINVPNRTQAALWGAKHL